MVCVVTVDCGATWRSTGDLVPVSRLTRLFCQVDSLRLG